MYNNNNVYKYIANLTKLHSIPDTMTDGITTVTSDLNIANCFNKYFYSVFTKSSYTDPFEDTSPSFAPDIDNISFSITDVFNILSTLNTSKAMGIDNISPMQATKELCLVTFSFNSHFIYAVHYYLSAT